MNIFLNILLILYTAQNALADDKVTQTVYGFLDFTTTIGNTVMVFSPQSAPKFELNFKSQTPVKIIETKPIDIQENSINDAIKPTKPSSLKSSAKETENVILATHTSVLESASPSESPAQSISLAPASSSSSSPPPEPNPSPSIPAPSTPLIVTSINSKKEIPKKPNANVKVNIDSEVKVVENIDKPEYDMLSRQPTEYAEENFRVVNHKANQSNFKKNRATTLSSKRAQETLPVSPTDRHPVGLVTKFTGSALNEGTTTLYETSVIGTYISGKYAQVLQSSSSIVSEKKPKIRPTSSSSLRVLSTATHVLPKPGTIKPANRFNANRSKPKTTSTIVNSVTAESYPTTESYEISTKKSSSRRKSKRRNKNTSRPTSSSSTNGQRVKFVTPSPSAEETTNRKSFRPKIQHSSIVNDDSSTSVYMFKLNRTPGRWQYKTSPKPRVNIRKSTASENIPLVPSNITLSAALPPANIGSLLDSNLTEQSQNSILEQGGDLESSDSQNGAVLNNVDDDKRKFFVETLNVEISTPSGFKDTYYEIATIKTPFIFQAGVVKKTRYITVTSTYEKTLTSDPSDSITFEGPLTENILATATQTISPSSIDIGTTTLMPYHLQETEETPALETTIETFSLTQSKLKTQILPVINDRENNTSYLTLVQTYDITSFITATKTYSPQDNNFRTKNFKDIGDNLDEAGSEINLELEFGDENNDEPLHEEKHIGIQHDAQPHKSISTVPIHHSQSIDPQKQLDIYNLFNPQPGFTVITTTRPVIKLETLWESHIVPIVNGASTSFRTLSKSIGVIDKTDYQIESSTVALPTVPSAIPPVNPYLIPQTFQTITNSLVQQTLLTQTNSKILKLTFGARTALTTLYSTAIVPTAMTIYMTTTVPVQPSAAFPGFYPPPYPPFAYVG